MKIKQIMPAPPGWVVVTMQLVSRGEQGDVVYPRASPVLALALVFDDVEVDGIVVPLAQEHGGDGRLCPTSQESNMFPADTPMEFFLDDAEREAERINEVRKGNNSQSPPVRAMILDATVRRARDQADLKELVDQLRKDGRYFGEPSSSDR